MNRLRLVLGFVPSRFQWVDGLIVMLISAATRFYLSTIQGLGLMGIELSGSVNLYDLTTSVTL